MTRPVSTSITLYGSYTVMRISKLDFRKNLGSISLNPKLIIFDCDGVLVDSEPISNRVLADLLSEIGIAMTYEKSLKLFLG